MKISMLLSEFCVHLAANDIRQSFCNYFHLSCTIQQLIYLLTKFNYLFNLFILLGIIIRVNSQCYDV